MIMSGDIRWPNGARAAISFTMDNLGEAQDVNKGQWPADQPIGSHYSVKDQLPRMLDMLQERGVKATFFAESWSLGVYPDVVGDMSRRGHEVAWHGYQHESWGALSPEKEDDNFRKSFDAAAEFGITYKGFRPPGGAVHDRTLTLLKERGLTYISPLGQFGVQNDIVVLPFEWETVDAFYYMDKFSGIRESHGAPSHTLAPGDFKDYLLRKIQNVIQDGGYMSILFHPFLQLDEEKFAVMGEILDRISKEKDLWCAPCRDVAQWVLDHGDSFAGGKTEIKTP